jgi:Domain of unknown function (DUF4157)
VRAIIGKRRQTQRDVPSAAVRPHLIAPTRKRLAYAPERPRPAGDLTRFAHDFSRVPVHSGRPPALQTKLRVSSPGDAYEQEADRIAERVTGAGEYSESPRQGLSRKADDAARASASRGPDGGKELEPGDRRFFEPRFDHNFAGVRVHAGREANESARALRARAYTVGSDIFFAANEYRPLTGEGRRLLSHELAHVVQQRNMSGPGSTIVQRQPEQAPAKQTPPPKKTTLQSEGVDSNDPVAGKTAGVIDAVLARNQRLAPYIGERIKTVKIGEKGKFVHEVNDKNFENAHKEAFDSDPDSGTVGFYDHAKTKEIHLRSAAKFGTALHEAVHKMAAPSLYTYHLVEAKHISNNLLKVMAEGVTAFFTDSILHDEGLPDFNDAYRTLKDKAKTLVDALNKSGADGFDLLARYNFKGDARAIGNALGFSDKQYIAANAKGEAAKEVLKRINGVVSN